VFLLGSFPSHLFSKEALDDDVQRSWGMCRWHLGLSFIVSPIGLITFFVLSFILRF
jgi:hypothetical protein